MAKWRKATNFLDTTVKSGDKRFAPTWDLLGRYRGGEIDEEGYEKEFLQLMRTSFKEHKEFWRETLSQEVLTIGCYCRAGKFCHRHILVEVFKRACEYFEIDFEYHGEII